MDDFYFMKHPTYSPFRTIEKEKKWINGWIKEKKRTVSRKYRKLRKFVKQLVES